MIDGAVVQATERSNINTVIINGRERKRSGVVLSVDQAKRRCAIDGSCFHLFNGAGCSARYVCRIVCTGASSVSSAGGT